MNMKEFQEMKLDEFCMFFYCMFAVVAISGYLFWNLETMWQLTCMVIFCTMAAAVVWNAICDSHAMLKPQAQQASPQAPPCPPPRSGVAQSSCQVFSINRGNTCAEGPRKLNLASSSRGVGFGLICTTAAPACAATRGISAAGFTRLDVPIEKSTSQLSALNSHTSDSANSPLPEAKASITLRRAWPSPVSPCASRKRRASASGSRGAASKGYEKVRGIHLPARCDVFSTRGF
jgi:hypothetical protein